ncbi:16S rRNA (cytosine(1402)-N(4))-methyltransferase RsmH [Candidatus Falkowbacteria bacterium]|uniref:Ribosomal RNA small subunit methyltransferase H n=1 Tax=Candidatus Falkowbacteria bacterium CG10_big_fil_rev_8_21_14_0_10_37_18 TaxID=1974562 RepID=A0A2H0V951_9BACT|nr:16S rRNA (cytosine(1402)-N(4))-methyltransferase RsmH [Candidatus Falkowbacteria bacterium]NCQ12673.1 16S rRNA (cytosine(1402)-N(4))-methyltransferase RsmH [Candidatus Falkowbacteria bacterium]OIO06237.1 MAG: 16S rRNA (cytosine(1402)-N(4))-methyltransferase [Candidatus Falkowbacteria bacterium CG1_02_37_21]PIR95637.1 MAG: 16S rRNA (cytosine(1402)-N(4))-methyltransferase [Candidatus Falkowbacteria bacterium CG10_big_fil_rev_8_21_14_0_10_37_18]
MYEHIPVLMPEALEYLQPKTGGHFIDCTLGGGGYTFALADKVGASGKILAIDQDELALNNTRAKIKTKKLKNIIVAEGNFKNLKDIVADNVSDAKKFDGIVFDLGLSSAQLADEERGFSFQGDRPLNMAFGLDSTVATEDIVNNYSLLELTRIFREYGEERQSYYIAKAIVAARHEKRIKTTAELVAIIEQAVPFRFRTRIHPATKIFQALRMETNGELDALIAALPEAVSLLKPGGRLVLVSFHSGEDRIVKRFFKNTPELLILTKRPLIPQEEEIIANPRSRSAKLRAAELRREEREV